MYLFEDSLFRVTSVSSVPTALNRSRVDAVLTTLLACRQSSGVSATNHANVYKLRTNAMGEAMGLMVGGERTSCRQMAISFVEDHASFDNQLFVPHKLVENFLTARKLQQEQMAICLLLPLTFYKLLSTPQT